MDWGIRCSEKTNVLAKCLCWVTNKRVDREGRITTNDLIEEVGIMAETKPFINGGKVLTFGSIGWGFASRDESSVEYKITANAINFLLLDN